MKKSAAVLLFFLFLIACKTNKPVNDSGPEEFYAFYDRFHSDMQFQMNRITFPLEGGSAQIEGTIPWTKDNWITMKVKIFDVDQNQYATEHTLNGDLFVQKFQLKGSGFGAEYRFKRIKGKWYLVYALDTNL